VNVTTKVSGQLNADGKYLTFKSGVFSLKQYRLHIGKWQHLEYNRMG
jgi:hypothetical protein